MQSVVGDIFNYKKVVYKGECMNTRNVGSFYEKKAIEYLKKENFKIIASNYSCKIGEIDVIATKENTLHFIEIKYRKNLMYGNPLEAVNYKKQQKIYKTAMWFLNENQIFMDFQCSFDVIAITEEQIQYIYNCFGVM